MVDFKRKAWETSRQEHRESRPDALAVVMAHGESSRGGTVREDNEQQEVLRELGAGRGTEKESSEALKAKRLAAAKKRMQQRQVPQQ